MTFGNRRRDREGEREEGEEADRHADRQGNKYIIFCLSVNLRIVLFNAS